MKRKLELSIRFTLAVNLLRRWMAPLATGFRIAQETKPHHQRNSSGVLSVGRFRRSVIYRPLAIALAILLVPSFSWFESTAGIDLGASAKAFQASAQIIIPIGTCNT